MDLMTLAEQAEDAGVLRVLPLKLRMALLFNRVKRYQTWNAKQVMDHFFTDDKLKAFFTGILADMTVLPSEFMGLGVPGFNQESAFDDRMPAQVSPAGPRHTFTYVADGCGSLVEAGAGGIREEGGRVPTSRPGPPGLGARDR